jgi:hypothetical protein
MKFSYSRYNPQIRLSQEEMLEISQEINREFAPGFSDEIANPAYQYKLSPKEMFEISEEIRLNYAPRASDNTPELVLLPVDPDHLYVYWNLGDDKLNSAKKNASENQLALRIYAEPNKSTDITETKPCFDFAIDSAKAQQKIFLPRRTPETSYYATIGKRYQDSSLTPLANSNITHVPLGKVMPLQAKESQLEFKPMPRLITENREISLYRNNSASGQGNN